MKIFERIQNLFSNIEIHIDFIDTKFELSFYRNNKSVLFSDVMKNSWAAQMFSGAVLGDKEHQAILPVSSMLDIYLRPNNFGNAKIQLVYEDTIKSLRFVKLIGEKLFQFTFNQEMGVLCRKVKDGVLLVEPGYYVENNTIWYLSDDNIIDIINRPVVYGEVAIDMIKGKYPCIDTDLQIAGQSISVVSGRFTAYQQFELHYESKEPDQKAYIKGIPGYCVIGGFLYKESSKLQEYFNGGKQITLLGEQIPTFIDTNIKWFFEFGDQKIIHTIMEEIFIKAEELELDLFCLPEAESYAAGQSQIVPKLICQDQLYDAESISAQMEQDFIYLNEKWARVSDIASAGIGPLGRLIDGTPIDSLELRPSEVIARGGKRLEGPWKKLLFPESLWYVSGSRAELYMYHLEFLRRHGLSGGVIIGDLTYEPELFAGYVRYLSKTIKTGSVLVLVRKKYYDACVQSGGFGDSIVYVKKSSEEEFLKKFHGVVVAFYNNLEKYPQLTNQKWSTLLLSEPDHIFKTDRSNLYIKVKAILAKVRVGSFSIEIHEMSEQQREAVMSMFRLFSEYDRNFLKYYFRYIGRMLDLPEPYSVHIKQEIRMEQAILVEIDGANAKGIPIPPRTDSPYLTDQMDYNRKPLLQTWNASFVKEARKYEHYTGSKTAMVPYNEYDKPQYQYMNASQLKWYFYWRSEARKRNYIKSTSSSYVFLYAFEIINGIGIENKIDGYLKLKALREIYSLYGSKFKDSLTQWLFDYLLIHNLTEYLHNFILEVDDDSDYMIQNLRIYYKYIQSKESLLWEDIRWLSSYRITDSRFYQAGNEELLKIHIVKAFKLIDEGLFEKYNKTIIQMFHPVKKQKQMHCCYPQAIYAGYDCSYIELFDYYEHTPLRDFIGSVIKYVENKLRIKNGFTGRLKITLERVFQELIDVYFGDAVKSNEPEKNLNIVSIDIQALNQIRQESNELRDLLANEEKLIDHPLKNISLTVGTEFLKEFEIREDSVDIVTDASGGVIDHLSDIQKKILLKIFEAPLAAEYDEWVLSQEFMAETLCDEINEQLYDEFGDLVIDTSTNPPSIIEDYCKELKTMMEKVND